MKQFIWLACLMVLITGLLNSCGSIRPGSINHRDSVRIDAEDNYFQQGARSRTLSVDNQNLDYDHKKQSYKVLDETYGQPTPNGGMVGGIAINDWSQHKIRFFIPNDILDETVGPGQTIGIDLPIGDYTLTCYDMSSIKDVVVLSEKRLSVTNRKNKGYLGTKYYFVLQR